MEVHIGKRKMGVMPKCKQETIISVTGQNVVAVKKSENAI